MSVPHKALVVGSAGFLGHAISSAYIRHGWEVYGLTRNAKNIQKLAAREITPIVAALDDPSLPSTLETKAQYFSAIVFSIDQFWDFLQLLETIISLSSCIADFSKTHGVKPLVLLTSGMKDFGETGLDGTPGLHPVTEADQLNPPAVTSERALNCDKILEYGDIFDAAVISPPHLYGYSGSGYGYFFKKAEEAEKVCVLEFAADARTILHSAHVDDCAEAYVALSQDQVRSQVRQQVFNIAGSRYETLGQIAGALVGEYGISGGAKFRPEERRVEKGLEYFIAGFSEWVSSEKIRRITGWNDKRAIFHEKIHLYRQSYEAARAQGRMELEALEAISKERTG